LHPNARRLLEWLALVAGGELEQGEGKEPTVKRTVAHADSILRSPTGKDCVLEVVSCPQARVRDVADGGVAIARCA
jgi:hypothetical protein